MDVVDLLARYRPESTDRAEVVARARALRAEARSLRCESENLRSEHRRLKQSAYRRCGELSARGRLGPQVPSPWSSLLWQPLAETLDDVLFLVPEARRR